MQNESFQQQIQSLMFKECGLQVLPETTRTAHSSVHLGLNHLQVFSLQKHLRKCEDTYFVR